MLDSLKNPLLLIGRLLFALMFLPAGWAKLTGFAGSVGYTASGGIPLPEVATALALALEILGSLALIFGLFAAQLVYKLKWRLEELALFFFGTAMACLHVRFLLVFVPFFAPLFATLLARWIPGYGREKDQYWLNAALMVVMLVAMVHYFPVKAKIEKNIATTYPSGAVEYMRTHPMPARMLNSYGFGGYLEWTGAREKVFIDGRGELYELGGVFADYMHINLLKPGALSVLRGYQVQACLLDRDQPLAVFLAALPEWQTVYADNVSVLLLRRDLGAGSGVITKEARNFAPDHVALLQ